MSDRIDALLTKAQAAAAANAEGPLQAQQAEWEQGRC